MSRWLWIVGLVTGFFALLWSGPGQQHVEFAGIAIIAGSVIWHLCQKDNLAARYIGSRWPWLAGCVAILVGTAVVLPALAKIKQEGAFAALTVEALTLGILITLSGLAFLTRGIKSLYARPV